jgi:hypothetical protein
MQAPDVQITLASVVQQHNQDDQRDRYSEQPQKNRHGVLLSVFCFDDG